ncbi:unnamed protein product [Rodentolepis nana]|uniref:Transposase n=1 Tax=Rodentolepis nana TaxID=102285 RepID=A0A0R3TNZ6_RODNA|nr:unnamed protein product [Rodentolepis nana]
MQKKRLFPVEKLQKRMNQRRLFLHHPLRFRVSYRTYQATADGSVLLYYDYEDGSDDYGDFDGEVGGRGERVKALT